MSAEDSAPRGTKRSKTATGTATAMDGEVPQTCATEPAQTMIPSRWARAPAYACEFDSIPDEEPPAADERTRQLPAGRPQKQLLPHLKPDLDTESRKLSPTETVTTPTYAAAVAATQAELVDVVSAKRQPGRPPKVKTEGGRAAAAQHLDPVTGKRKRGRPCKVRMDETGGGDALIISSMPPTPGDSLSRAESPATPPPAVGDAGGVRLGELPGVQIDLVSDTPLQLGEVMARMTGSGGATRMIGREEERAAVEAFLKETVGSRRAGALYISGKPGTGKSSLVRDVLAARKKHGWKAVALNGMSLCDGAKDLFSELLKGLDPKACKEKIDPESALYERCISRPRRAEDADMTLVLIDEMDALLQGTSGGQRVLETIFGWAAEPDARLVLIGIANALDLTHRLLPVLHAKGCAPQLLTFKPYTDAAVRLILGSRLSAPTPAPALAPEHSSDGPVNVNTCRMDEPTLLSAVEEPASRPDQGKAMVRFESTALQLCARRTAAESGDVRKALEACRAAAREAVLQGVDGNTCAVVGVGLMSRTLTALSAQSNASRRLLGALPTHQALVLCALVLAAREEWFQLNQAALLAGYSRVCRKHSLEPVPAAQFAQLAGALADLGAVRVTGSARKGFTYALAGAADAAADALAEQKDLYRHILDNKPRASAVATL
jgi:Cdc6-like AAA superfamily ATPase